MMPHLTVQIHKKTHDIFLADYNRLVHLCGLLRLAGAARTLQRVYLMSCIVGFLCWSPDRCMYYIRPTKICSVILPHNRIPTFHSVPCSLGDVHHSFISSVESQNPVPGHSPRPVSPSGRGLFRQELAVLRVAKALATGHLPPQVGCALIHHAMFIESIVSL